MRVAIVDMQPIDPPIGGGRLRILGLYHSLGAGIRATYTGTYDWPGEPARHLRLSETLDEIDIPLSGEHFAAESVLRGFAHGKTIIDSTFPVLGHLSAEYVERATEEIDGADVVIFAHPWVFPLVSHRLDRDRQLIVYDAQNFEAGLKLDLLGGEPFCDEIVKQVAWNERHLAREADLVLAACSEDSALFRSAYHVEPSRVAEVPNGAFVSRIRPATEQDRFAAKASLGVAGLAVVFVGSGYGPNIEAARFIVLELAPKLRECEFLVCGGVGVTPEVRDWARAVSNVRLTGPISEAAKNRYLQAADLAVNPMWSGSGTNIKMFDFMAAGLPVISTRMGARGIAKQSEAGLIIEDLDGFEGAVRRLAEDRGERRTLGAANRSLVEKEFAWEEISPRLGALLRERLEEKRRAAGQMPREVVASGRRHIGGIVDAGMSRSTAGRGLGSMTVLSSALVRCGVASYTWNFCAALRPHLVKLSLVGNETEALRTVGRGLGPFDAVDTGWIYDNISWINGSVNVPRVLDVADREGAQSFNVQYHCGFFEALALVALIGQLTGRGVATSVTLHNSGDMPEPELLALAATEAVLFVHQWPEVARLRALGLPSVKYLPMGVPDIPRPDKEGLRRTLGLRGNPVIGCFGYLRPHKGVIELIRAIGLLKRLYPDVVLLSLNSLYPSPDSEACRGQCLEVIRQEGLTGSVQLRTEFLEDEAVLSLLQACDLTVLPYHGNGEGASAAAAFCLAAKRPLVTSRSRIFDNLQGVSYPLGSVDPEVIAVGLATVLSNRSLLASLELAAERFVERNSWPAVARAFVEAMSRHRASSPPTMRAEDQRRDPAGVPRSGLHKATTKAVDGPEGFHTQTSQPHVWLERLIRDQPALHYVTSEMYDRIVQASPEQASNIKIGPFSMAVPPRVLRYIATCVQPHHRTIETGCGQTTVALAALAAHHTAVTPDEIASRNILEYMDKLGIPRSKVTFRFESSEFVLPAMYPMAPEEMFDFAFIDGCHGYPLPTIDWHYIDYFLKVGGVIGFDNTEIRAVQHHCAFLEENDSYAVREKLDFRPEFEYGVTFFTKLKNQHREWVFQAFNTRPRERHSQLQ